MQEIESLRQEIDRIHQDMAQLFRQRLAVTEKIWRIKQDLKKDLIDPKREENIIHQFDSFAKDESEKRALQNLLKVILVESKKYVEAKLK